MNQSSPRKKPLFSYARYSSMAFQMLAVIILGVFGGFKLDSWLDLKLPVFTVVLSVLSVGISIYLVTRDLLK